MGLDTANANQLVDEMDRSYLESHRRPPTASASERAQQQTPDLAKGAAEEDPESKKDGPVPHVNVGVEREAEEQEDLEDDEMEDVPSG